MKDILELSSLIKKINDANEDIAEFIGRPASANNIGESIAAEILKLRFIDEGTNFPRIGAFSDGPLSGKNVAVSWRPRFCSLVNFTMDVDFFLYFMECRKFYRIFHEYYRPMLINSVHLFSVETIIEIMGERDQGPRLHPIITMPDHWDEAEIFPKSSNPLLKLSEKQKEMFALFSG